MNMTQLAGAALLACLTAMAGCTAIQPFPMAARAGDTITLAVGSQDGMDRSNTTVSFTSDSDLIPVDLSPGIRSIFNLYADKASNSYSPSISNVDTNFRYLHHEPWQTVIVLDLPATLALGPGKIRVQTTAPQPVGALEPGYNGTYPDLNTVDIGMEILPGSGTSNPFRYKTVFDGTLTGNLRDLEPTRQALVRPPKTDANGQWPTPFGAIEIKMNMPMTDMSGTGIVDDSSVRLVTQDVSMFTSSKAQASWSYDGSTFTIMFISTSGQLQYYEPRFSVMAETADFTSTPTITSIRYFDMNGNETTGPAITDYSVMLLGSFL
ncbi:MAG TPA: hypothetical protein ENK05_10095 [Gammaproteobacteria bacterium]|nr:hypothetical protein [Gammaproteobacteria bacterium]